MKLYIECGAGTNNRVYAASVPFSNISFSHFAVSFPGFVPHVLLMAGSLILLARSTGGWVPTYVSHKRSSLGHMGKPARCECVHARAHIRSTAYKTKWRVNLYAPHKQVAATRRTIFGYLSTRYVLRSVVYIMLKTNCIVKSWKK